MLNYASSLLNPLSFALKQNCVSWKQLLSHEWLCTVNVGKSAALTTITLSVGIPFKFSVL